MFKRLCFALALAFAGSSSAFAAGSTVNALPSSPAVVGTQLVYCPVGTANDYKCTMSQLATYMNSLAGTVTSIATSCGATGGTITTTGTVSTAVVVDAAGTGSNYNIPTTDCGGMAILSNASAQTPTLTTASWSTGNFLTIVNTGVGTQTVTPSSGTICGNASQTLNTNQSIGVVFDGTNWRCTGIAGGGTTPFISAAAALEAMSVIGSM